ncbi:DUF4188 domain-containing protein [Alteraurantiacibacter aquimixticola]|uniref:DUF4188 domain-containing protein n=2 Tax=Alteraurantiacibacter aquimixticola TaxID=2489173 RepID=A0A4T3F3S1_9SPHN|nr:DUF4188 domain-containing protein [Alteraurantiacibacter aquimixticola]TIX51925.1 DUF4188 domain-containing protein [Alteraurantiacibacter aquimixticola]
MIEPGRLTDRHEGSLVVFLIGMRINHFLRPRQWLPVARSMGPMIAELEDNPESGFIGAETLLAGMRTVLLVQYWRDFARLEAYAQDRDRNHWPAWSAFNKAVGDNGSVGIFHETYCVPAGGFETISVNMPPFGLARFSGRQPATGSRVAARDRMSAMSEG